MSTIDSRDVPGLHVVVEARTVDRAELVQWWVRACGRRVTGAPREVYRHAGEAACDVALPYG